MPRWAAVARTLDERGRQECEVHRALRHVVQNRYRMQHGVVVDGDGVVIAALEGPHLRPAAVGILRVKQVLDAALDRGAEGRRFGIAMRGQQCGSDVGQEANLHPGGVVVERGDVMPVGIDGLVEIGVVAKAVEIVGVVQVAGARGRLTMSMFLLQPPSGTCQVTMLRAARIASSLVHQSAGWSRRSANMPRPPVACFGLVLPAVFCSAARACLSIAFCFSERSRYSSQAFCSFLGRVAMRSGVSGLAIAFMPITLAEAVAGRPSETSKAGSVTRSATGSAKRGVWPRRMIGFVSRRNRPCQWEV